MLQMVVLLWGCLAGLLVKVLIFFLYLSDSRDHLAKKSIILKKGFYISHT